MNHTTSSTHPAYAEEAKRKNYVLDKALSCLLHRLNRGEEFPDACFMVSVTHKVSYTALQNAYDLECLSPRTLPKTTPTAGLLLFR